MKTNTKTWIRLIAGIGFLSLQGCFIYSSLTDDFRECTVTFRYEIRVGEANGDTLQGSFSPMPFEVRDVPVTEQIVSSTCKGPRPASVENIYPRVSWKVNQNTADPGDFLFSMEGPDNQIGKPRDMVDFPADSAGNLYRQVGINISEGQPTDIWGKLIFDIPNQRLIFEGTRRLKEEIGKE